MVGGAAVERSAGNDGRAERWRRRLRVTLVVVFGFFVAPALLSLAARAFFFDQPHWREARHAPTGQAPSPHDHSDAVAQVYAARTWGWRGGVAVHT